jgi:hypothetical protein
VLGLAVITGWGTSGNGSIKMLLLEGAKTFGDVAGGIKLVWGRVISTVSILLGLAVFRAGAKVAVAAGNGVLGICGAGAVGDSPTKAIFPAIFLGSS